MAQVILTIALPLSSTNSFLTSKVLGNDCRWISASKSNEGLTVVLTIES